MKLSNYSKNTRKSSYVLDHHIKETCLSWSAVAAKCGYKSGGQLKRNILNRIEKLNQDLAHVNLKVSIRESY